MSDIRVKRIYPSTFNTNNPNRNTNYSGSAKPKDNSSENTFEIPEDSVELSEEAQALRTLNQEDDEVKRHI